MMMRRKLAVITRGSMISGRRVRTRHRRLIRKRCDNLLALLSFLRDFRSCYDYKLTFVTQLVGMKQKIRAKSLIVCFHTCS